jgi:enoyl-CoA hydratase/carnithine racemase
MAVLPEFANLEITIAPRLDSAEDSRVAHVTLNRPERLNALSRDLLRDIVGVSRWLDEQRNLTVVVLRGAGRAFSAGFDLNDFQQPDPNLSPRDAADLGRLATEALANVRQLTIASVHGHCVGGGVVLTAACDLRIAATDARFVIPEVDLGIPLAWGGIPRLVRELGPAITKELVLTCRPFDAHEARSLRFVNHVVRPDELIEATDKLAHELAAKPSFALRTTKQQVNAALDEMVGTARNANDADTLVFATNDPESREVSRQYLARRMAKG